MGSLREGYREMSRSAAGTSPNQKRIRVATTPTVRAFNPGKGIASTSFVGLDSS
jgi:hypothetical protein